MLQARHARIGPASQGGQRGGRYEFKSSGAGRSGISAQAELSEDVLILCDNESVLKVIKNWIVQGGRATLAEAPDADILREILELLRARIEVGRATFFVKVKSHRGEPMNERADTLALRKAERGQTRKNGGTPGQTG